MSENNFSDTLVEEYDLFGKVFPSHDDLQDTIPSSLRGHFPASDGTDLVFLDIGAGYGFTSKLVSNIFPKAKYILNEFDAALISRADAYLKEYNYEKKIGDIEEVIKEIADNSLDAVYTAWVIHNFPQIKRAVVLKEIARVLKPGGIYVALEKVGNTGTQRDKDLAQSIINFEPFISKYNRSDLFIQWVKHNLRDEESDLVFTDDENERLLVENNFEWKYVKHILLEKVVVAIKK